MMRLITLLFFWYHKGFRRAYKQRSFYPRGLLTRIEKVLKQTIKVLIDQNTFFAFTGLQSFKRPLYFQGVCENFGNSEGEGGGVYFRGWFWKIQRGGGSCGKSLPWGWLEYFLEPHIINQIYFKKSWKGDLYLCIFLFTGRSPTHNWEGLYVGGLIIGSLRVSHKAHWHHRLIKTSRKWSKCNDGIAH